jgi:hypothetical protein
MDKPQSLPSIARVTFVIHAIVAVIIGLAMLFIPATWGSWVGYPGCPGVEPPLRAFGAMILGFGAVTSVYGFLAKSWERVDYIVRGEITWLAMGTIVFVVSAIIGSGPLFGNAVFAVVSVILLALFVATWIARPK